MPDSHFSSSPRSLICRLLACRLSILWLLLLTLSVSARPPSESCSSAREASMPSRTELALRRMRPCWRSCAAMAWCTSLSMRACSAFTCKAHSAWRGNAMPTERHCPLQPPPTSAPCPMHACSALSCGQNALLTAQQGEHYAARRLCVSQKLLCSRQENTPDSQAVYPACSMCGLHKDTHADEDTKMPAQAAVLQLPGCAVCQTPAQDTSPQAINCCMHMSSICCVLLACTSATDEHDSQLHAQACPRRQQPCSQRH